MNKQIMKQAGFTEELKQIEVGNCPICRKPINLEDFRNALSKREYEISKMCNACQDLIFGP
jgi:hypothetical protein